MSRKKQNRSGRGADKGKRNPRTYYAINKESTDIYRFMSHDDRQRAVESEGLDPLTAQEFLQFKIEGKVRIHEMPRQVSVMPQQEQLPKVESAAPVSYPPSYTEAPRSEATAEESTNPPQLPSSEVPQSEIVDTTTEVAQHLSSAAPNLPTNQPSISLTVEQFKEILAAAIVEALSVWQRQHGTKIIPADPSIMGEQPTGNRQTHNH